MHVVCTSVYSEDKYSESFWSNYVILGQELLRLSTIPRTWRIYGARITGPVEAIGVPTIRPFCTVHLRVGEIVHEYQLFQYEDTYHCSFDALQ